MKKFSKWQVFVVNESRTWKCFHEFWFGESDSLKQSMYRLHSGKQRHLWGSWSLVDSLAYYLIDDQQATLHVSNLWSLYITNIASTSKAALHKLPGKSSLNVGSVCPVIPIWLVCPVCHVCSGCLVRPVLVVLVVLSDLSVLMTMTTILSILPVLSNQPVAFPSRGSCKMSPQMTCLKSLNGWSYLSVTCVGKELLGHQTN